ncbi:MAG TPA: phospholipid carrier-dependent glycosyltransferase, partial [Blastocatellia bacterium]|nr:phospholipid carrier-dependent glycosyltransferase [Blastocatellia bacterium]
MLAAALPRIICALKLYNPDPDAYEYIETVTWMRAHLVGGRFSVRDLAGFWFPLYQFICACISLPFNHPAYVTRFFSAACGAAESLVVFWLAKELTGRRGVALAAFALVAFNPLHVLYSSYAMTEAPFGFFATASLYLLVKKRWTASAVMATAAGLIRVDAWIL